MVLVKKNEESLLCSGRLAETLKVLEVIGVGRDAESAGSYWLMRGLFS
jgi:hypothetical protein